MIKSTLSPEIQNDIRNITQINAVPSILNVVCRSTGMKFSAIARVTDKKWVTCVSRDEINFGLTTGDELVLETTICNEIRQHHQPIIIEEVAKSAQFCNHHTPMQYGFQSYISFPIYRKDGRFFGTLCAIDPEPRDIDNTETRELFELYAQLISFHLDAVEELNELNTSLRQEKQLGELRETFIAILGHDLRNPVGTTRMCADMLLHMDLPEAVKRNASLIKSTSYRMQSLIDNLLDFAKGHLGNGIQLELTNDREKLIQSLDQVAQEVQTLDAGQQIHHTTELFQQFSCDIDRICQLYANLLGNAVKHGAADQPIETEIRAENGTFSIKVSNAGPMIPEEKKINLFKPFFSTNSANNKSGLGLGLYISSEIAKAHNGTIEVSSTGERTTFTFSMPIHPSQ